MRDVRHVVLLAALTLSASCAQQTLPATEAPRIDANEIGRLRRERDALRDLTNGTITLSQALRQAGGRLTLDASPNLDDARLPDVPSLTRESQVVVLARHDGEQHVQLSDDERSIVTRYTVNVDDVIRAGDANEPRTPTRLIVEVPGGSLTLEDGEAAVVNGPTFERGAKYMLFLQHKDSTSTARVTSNPVFVVTGLHYEGILPIDGASMVRSATARPPLQTRQPFNGRSVVSLVAEVRAAR